MTWSRDDESIISLNFQRFFFDKNKKYKKC